VFAFCSITMLRCANISSTNNPHSALQQIGRQLFYDNRLSINQSKSCGSCHNPNLYFTDGYKQSIGWYGDVQLRNSPSIINSANRKSLNWANPEITDFETQMSTPLFSKQHFEMGMDEKNINQPTLILSAKKYSWFYKDSATPKTWAFIKLAIAAYCKTIISRNSTYDLFIQTKDSALFTATQWQGYELFFSERLKCGFCHGGKDFDTPLKPDDEFANIGLYNINGSYAHDDNGLYNNTKLRNDMGKFKIPSLRNITKTAPYYHDGSGANLTDVLDNYGKGGKHITSGIFAGDGRLHPHKNKLVNGFTIDENQKRALVAFLETLTDTTILLNTWFNNPNQVTATTNP
jgi:cytochrome c peroxidase